RKGKGRVEHAIIQDEQQPPVVLRRESERRATARVLCNSPARVRSEGQSDEREEFATLRDISAAGIGIHLGDPLPPETVLVIEPLSPGPRTLLARVVRTVPEGSGWLHGCILSLRLSDEELSIWLGNGEISPPPLRPSSQASLTPELAPPV